MLILLGSSYVGCDQEVTTLDNDMREEWHARTGATFVELSDGHVRYQLTGPSDGPTVALIHGASGPMEVWDMTMEALAGAGFRVLRYDLYGRGGSDRIAVVHDAALYERQLEDLLRALDLAGPLHLVGSSMGAMIAAGFANAHPERVRSLCFIGPAGFPLQANPAALSLQVPWLGEYLIATIGDRMLASHNRAYFAEPDAFSPLHDAFRRQLEIRGTKRAILSTIRHMPLNDFADGYAAVGARTTPVLLVWGREDRTFPFAHHVRMRELIPRSDFLAVDDAAHLPQAERPDMVNPRLVGFLQER